MAYVRLPRRRRSALFMTFATYCLLLGQLVEPAAVYPPLTRASYRLLLGRWVEPAAVYLSPTRALHQTFCSRRG